MSVLYGTRLLLKAREDLREGTVGNITHMPIPLLGSIQLPSLGI